MTQKELKMIKEFQCSGCVSGSSPEDDCYSPSTLDPSYPFFRCNKQCPGTTILGLGTIYLGLPKGFNRVGSRSESAYRRAGNPGENTHIRLWCDGDHPGWDKFEVAVWAMEQNGFLFVRTYSPRINAAYIDVIEGGTLEMCPNTIDVGKFIDDID